MDARAAVERRCSPGRYRRSRVVYVDNDPVALTHARALLVGDADIVTDYIDAEIRDAETILNGAAGTLDFQCPVAVMLLGVLEFVPDPRQASAIIARLMGAVPSGSYLLISHSTNEVHREAMEEAARLWNEGGSTALTLRGAPGLADLFNGLELVEPGVVSCPLRHPDATEVGRPVPVARKR